ncbi:MAG: AMP-binding protein, partial [Planctomycetota bacterium]
MRAGLVVVPLFLADAADTTSFILRDSAARLLFVERAEDWERIDAAGASPVGRVVFRSGPAHPSDGRQINLADWIAAGTQGQTHPPAERPTACGSDLATIVYTSGTTGRPKGVMLTHSAVLAVSRSILERAPGTADDVFLSYLPLAHIFERVVGIVVPATIGATVVFARSIADLPADLRSVRPTILLAVPSLLDRVRSRVLERVADSAFRAWLLELTVRTGMICYEARRDGRPVGVASWLLHKILRRLVGRPILSALG